MNNQRGSCEGLELEMWEGFFFLALGGLAGGGFDLLRRAFCELRKAWEKR